MSGNLFRDERDLRSADGLVIRKVSSVPYGLHVVQ